MMDLTCRLCGNAMHPSDRQELLDGTPVHTYCGRKEVARQSYRFYIQNPPDRPNVGFGFWYRDGDREYAMLENTGGMTIYASAEVEMGDSIPVKPEFIEAFGLGWHWLMCYQPATEDRLAETVEEIGDDYYPGVIGSHERWALTHLLLHALLSPDPLPHEWQPLIDFADQCTKMGVPEVRDG